MKDISEKTKENNEIVLRRRENKKQPNNKRILMIDKKHSVPHRCLKLRKNY